MRISAMSSLSTVLLGLIDSARTSPVSEYSQVSSLFLMVRRPGATEAVEQEAEATIDR